MVLRRLLNANQYLAGVRLFALRRRLNHNEMPKFAILVCVLINRIIANFTPRSRQEHFIPGVIIATRAAEEAIHGKGGRDDVEFEDNRKRKWLVTPKSETSSLFRISTSNASWRFRYIPMADMA